MSTNNKVVTARESLASIQAKIKAPKTNKNTFGKYLYRTVADILEAVKRVINPLGLYVTLSDEVVYIGDRVFVKATAGLHCAASAVHVECHGYALHPFQQAGMSDSQLTGNASSYARKAALAGLFAIDDGSIDPDSVEPTDMRPITKKQVAQLNGLITKNGFDKKRFLNHIGAENLESICAERFSHALEVLRKQAQKTANKK